MVLKEVVELRTGFAITSSTTKRDCRARARQVALYIASSAVNDSWRFGTFRADLKPAGRR